MAETGYHVVHVYADNQFEWNCSQWRMLTPADACNRAGGRWKAKLIHVSGFMFFLDPAIQDLVGPSDLIIFQRNMINDQTIAAMQYWQGMGKPVCIDLDDAYQMLPWCNHAKNFWHLREDGEALKVLLEGLRLSDGLISPNHLLLSDFSPYTKGYYLQNYAEKAWWTDLPSREELKREKGLDSDSIIIGWGGSLSHYDSWWGSGLREAATRVSARHPEVVWMVCGSDGRIFEQLDVPMRQKIMQQGVPPSEWPRIVSTFDIGVAPLFGAYDQRRSWIKGIEYLLGGVPWIGQEGEVYKDLEGLGTLIPPTANAWEEALEYKVEHLKEDQEAAKSLIPQARDAFIVDNNLDVFAEVYHRIMLDFSDSKVTLPNVFYLEPQNGKEISASAEETPEVSGELERQLP